GGALWLPPDDAQAPSRAASTRMADRRNAIMGRISTATGLQVRTRNPAICGHRRRTRGDAAPTWLSRTLRPLRPGNRRMRILVTGGAGYIGSHTWTVLAAR